MAVAKRKLILKLHKCNHLKIYLCQTVATENISLIISWHGSVLSHLMLGLSFLKNTVVLLHILPRVLRSVSKVIEFLLKVVNIRAGRGS